MLAVLRIRETDVLFGCPVAEITCEGAQGHTVDLASRDPVGTLHVQSDLITAAAGDKSDVWVVVLMSR